MSSAKEVTRYRAGTASLLAESVEAAGEIEQWLDRGVDDGEAGSLLQAWVSKPEEELSSAMTVPEDDPARLYRIICASLLHKARIHGRAVLRANKTNNVHSLAVQMRPVLECAGQVVRIFHHLIIAPRLLMEPERAGRLITDYLDRDYYDTLMRAMKDNTIHSKLLQTISEAAEAAAMEFGMPKPKVGKGKPLKQVDKVAMLSGGPGWYDHLSDYFCHGKANWKGPSWQGGVTSMDIIHELTCADMMGYLAVQVSTMNSYAYLCPVDGKVDFDRAMAVQVRRREVRQAVATLRSAVGLPANNNEAGQT